MAVSLTTAVAKLETMIRAVPSAVHGAAWAPFAPRLPAESGGDAALPGRYHLSISAPERHRDAHGRGQPIWLVRVAIELGFRRGGVGDLDARLVEAAAMDDCIALADALELADAAGETTGIRSVTFAAIRRGRRRTVQTESWAVELVMEWVEP